MPNSRRCTCPTFDDCFCFPDDDTGRRLSCGWLVLGFLAAGALAGGFTIGILYKDALWGVLAGIAFFLLVFCSLNAYFTCADEEYREEMWDESPVLLDFFDKSVEDSRFGRSVLRNGKPKITSLRDHEYWQNFTQEIVIVGAGPAGLSAGCALKSLGINSFTILEAGDDVGGKLNSCARGTEDWVVKADNPDVLEDLLLFNNNESNPPFQLTQSPRMKTLSLLEREDRSAGTKRLSLKNSKWWMRQRYDPPAAASSHRFDSGGDVAHGGGRGAQDRCWRDYVRNNFYWPVSQHVKTGSVVKSIDTSDPNRVLVSTSAAATGRQQPKQDKKVFEAKKVILAVPPNALLPNSCTCYSNPSAPAAIAFEPELPLLKRSALEQMEKIRTLTVRMEFRRRFEGFPNCIDAAGAELTIFPDAAEKGESALKDDDDSLQQFLQSSHERYYMDVSHPLRCDSNNDEEAGKHAAAALVMVARGRTRCGAGIAKGREVECKNNGSSDDDRILESVLKELDEVFDGQATENYLSGDFYWSESFLLPSLSKRQERIDHQRRLSRPVGGRSRVYFCRDFVLSGSTSWTGSDRNDLEGTVLGALVSGRQAVKDLLDNHFEDVARRQLAQMMNSFAASIITAGNNHHDDN